MTCDESINSTQPPASLNTDCGGTSDGGSSSTPPLHDSSEKAEDSGVILTTEPSPMQSLSGSMKEGYQHCHVSLNSTYPPTSLSDEQSAGPAASSPKSSPTRAGNGGTRNDSAPATILLPENDNVDYLEQYLDRHRPLTEKLTLVHPA